jgi:hypothetical protein
MISEIVLFRLPDGMSRADAMTKYRARVPMWQANPDLIHKTFLFDEKSRRGGGVYLWKNIEAAKKAHGAAFEEAIQSIFGSRPEGPIDAGQRSCPRRDKASDGIA